MSGGACWPQWPLLFHSLLVLFHPFDPTNLTPTSPPAFPISRPRFHTRGRGRIGAGDIFLGHTTFLFFSDFLKTDKIYIMWNLPFQSFLSIWLSGIKYIHIILQPSPLSISRTFSIFPKWNSIPTKHWLPSPNPSHWQPPFYFVSMTLTSLGAWHKWNHMLFVFCVIALFHLAWQLQGLSMR